MHVSHSLSWYLHTVNYELNVGIIWRCVTDFPCTNNWYITWMCVAVSKLSLRCLFLIIKILLGFLVYNIHFYVEVDVK